MLLGEARLFDVYPVYHLRRSADLRGVNVIEVGVERLNSNAVQYANVINIDYHEFSCERQFA